MLKTIGLCGCVMVGSCVCVRGGGAGIGGGRGISCEALCRPALWPKIQCLKGTGDVSCRLRPQTRVTENTEHSFATIDSACSTW
jgi:hypothetical protein